MVNISQNSVTPSNIVRQKLGEGYEQRGNTLVKTITQKRFDRRGASRGSKQVPVKQITIFLDEQGRPIREKVEVMNTKKDNRTTIRRFDPKTGAIVREEETLKTREGKSRQTTTKDLITGKTEKKQFDPGFTERQKARRSQARNFRIPGRTTAITQPREGGGTITVSRTGKVTERDKKGRVVERYQADEKSTRTFLKEAKKASDARIRQRKGLTTKDLLEEQNMSLLEGTKRSIPLTGETARKILEGDENARRINRSIEIESAADLRKRRVKNAVKRQKAKNKLAREADFSKAFTPKNPFKTILSRSAKGEQANFQRVIREGIPLLISASEKETNPFKKAAQKNLARVVGLQETITSLTATPIAASRKEARKQSFDLAKRLRSEAKNEKTPFKNGSKIVQATVLENTETALLGFGAGTLTQLGIRAAIRTAPIATTTALTVATPFLGATTGQQYIKDVRESGAITATTRAILELGAFGAGARIGSIQKASGKLPKRITLSTIKNLRRDVEKIPSRSKGKAKKLISSVEKALGRKKSISKQELVKKISTLEDIQKSVRSGNLKTESKARIKLLKNELGTLKKKSNDFFGRVKRESKNIPKKTFDGVMRKKRLLEADIRIVKNNLEKGIVDSKTSRKLKKIKKVLSQINKNLPRAVRNALERQAKKTKTKLERKIYFGKKKIGEIPQKLRSSVEKSSKNAKKVISDAEKLAKELLNAVKNVPVKVRRVLRRQITLFLRRIREVKQKIKNFASLRDFNRKRLKKIDAEISLLKSELKGFPKVSKKNFVVNLPPKKQGEKTLTLKFKNKRDWLKALKKASGIPKGRKTDLIKTLERIRKERISFLRSTKKKIKSSRPDVLRKRISSIEKIISQVEKSKGIKKFVLADKNTGTELVFKGKLKYLNFLRAERKRLQSALKKILPRSKRVREAKPGSVYIKSLKEKPVFPFTDKFTKETRYFDKARTWKKAIKESARKTGEIAERRKRGGERDVPFDVDRLLAIQESTKKFLKKRTSTERLKLEKERILLRKKRGKPKDSLLFEDVFTGETRKLGTKKFRKAVRETDFFLGKTARGKKTPEAPASSLRFLDLVFETQRKLNKIKSSSGITVKDLKILQQKRSKTKKVVKNIQKDFKDVEKESGEKGLVLLQKKEAINKKKIRRVAQKQKQAVKTAKRVQKQILEAPTPKIRKQKISIFKRLGLEIALYSAFSSLAKELNLGAVANSLVKNKKGYSTLVKELNEQKVTKKNVTKKSILTRQKTTTKQSTKQRTDKVVKTLLKTSPALLLKKNLRPITRGKDVRVGNQEAARKRLNRFLNGQVGGRRFVYFPDLYSKIFGVRASKREKQEFLRVGRVFTGLERRKIVK